MIINNAKSTKLVLYPNPQNNNMKVKVYNYEKGIFME